MEPLEVHLYKESVHFLVNQFVWHLILFFLLANKRKPILIYFHFLSSA